MSLSAGLCTLCGGGSIEFVTSEPSGIIVLLCDECFSMWLDPADLGTDNVFSAKDAATVIPGTSSTLQRSHDSTEDELEARGWGDYVKT